MLVRAWAWYTRRAWRWLNNSSTYRTYPLGAVGSLYEPTRPLSAPQAQSKEPIMRSSHIKIIHLRLKAAKKQSRHCYYCNCLMTNRQPQLSCTAEHLVARSNHGKNSSSNIVAACKFCNVMRHRQFANLSPLEYAAAVKELVNGNRWHEHHSAWRSLA